MSERLFIWRVVGWLRSGDVWVRARCVAASKSSAKTLVMRSAADGWAVMSGESPELSSMISATCLNPVGGSYEHSFDRYLADCPFEHLSSIELFRRNR